MKKNKLVVGVEFFVILLLITFIINCIDGIAFAAASQQFSIEGPGIRKTYSKSELMKIKSRQTVIIEKDPAYGNQKMVYQAVPLTVLFEGIETDSFETMSFKCLDGFSGIISKARVLSKDREGATAFLAIERDDQKWPALRQGKKETAGPFYLIWVNPEKSKIMTEEWPFQLTGFTLSKQSLASQFPNTVPDKVGLENDPVARGYKLFMTNCFVCHSFNGDGAGKIGPDLNYPNSPSEYFQFKYFSMLVKNPQSLRTWELGRMPGFSNSLSDKDLTDIWMYFQHMSGKKRQL